MRTIEELDRVTIAEIEDAMRVPCEFDGCASGGGPASWRIEVRHGPKTHGVDELLICGVCRDQLHRYRHQQVGCPEHGGLGYSVAAWWRPLGVLR